MGAFGNFINSSAGNSAISGILGIGGGLILGNQAKQQAKNQANDAKAIADAQVKAQELAFTNSTIAITITKGWWG
jgi:uncharacterized protein YggE